MPLIDTEDLRLWTSKPESSIQLAELLCKLIRSTATELKKITLPVGKGVWRPGWDCILEHGPETEFIPCGVSLWEWGVGAPEAKANSDFAMRSADPKGKNISKSTFVFVTPHVWKGKEDWIKAKISGGSKWREIRVYDGDDLVQWIMQSPVSTYWLAKLIRSVPYEGFSLPMEFWDAWSKKDGRQIPIDLVFAGREFQVAQVQDKLAGGPSIVAVQASARDEAIAFLIATLLQAEPGKSEDYFSRALIVEDEKALRQLIYNKNRLILIARLPERDLFNLAVSRGHHVLLPLGADDGYTVKIDLPRLNRVVFTNALVSMGYSEEKAQQLSKETGRSITVFRRREGFDLNDPKWLKDGEIEAILPVLLAGKWDDSKSGDRSILEKLAGKPYDKLLDSLQTLQYLPDAPFKRIGTQWRLVSPLDAWSFLSAHCSSNHFELLKNAVLETLLEVDPALEISLDQRHFAAFNKKELTHSQWLRQGLLQSLILISLYGDRFKMAINAPADQWVDAIIGELLDHAESKLYRTLNSVVTELAEASPSAFMAGLEHGVADNPEDILSIFEEGSDTLFGLHYHSGYLWALESIAWDKRHVGRACVLLARLAMMDPGGRLSNRPAKSLLQVFVPWRPQTTATAKERGQVFEMLVSKVPERSWSLGLALIGRIQVQFQGHQFRWRPWDFSKQETQDPAEVGVFLSLVVDKLIALAGANGESIGELLQSADDAILPGINARLITHLQGVIDEIKAGRDELWKSLRSLLYFERFNPPNRLTVPPAFIPALDRIYVHLTPTSKVDANFWVFQDMRPKFPDGYEGLKGSDLTAEIKKRRLAAMREMYSEVGIDGLLMLIPGIIESGHFGAALAEGIEDGQECLKILQLLNSTDKAEGYAVRGYIAQMHSNLGMEWAKRQVANLQGLGFNEQAISRFLMALPFDRSTWELTEMHSETVGALYWAKTDAYFWGLSPADVQYAVVKLIPAGRCRTIMRIAEHRLKDLTTALLLILLNQALTDEAETVYLQPSDVMDAFALLDTRTDVDDEDFLRLELKYANLIVESTDRSTAKIHQEFCHDPAFFMQAVEIVSKEDDGTNKVDMGTLTEEQYAVFVHTWFKILYHWRRVPGMEKDGALDRGYLAAWVSKVQELGKKSNRNLMTGHYIGKMLFYVPFDKDGIPDVAVCDLLENLQSSPANQGYESEWINGQGPTFRDPFSGGGMERNEASTLKMIAERLALRWPSVATIFENLANSKVATGARIDVEASRMDHEY